MFYTGANDSFDTYLRLTSAQEELGRLAEPRTFELIKVARRVLGLMTGPAAATLAKLDREVLPRTAQSNSLRDGIIAADKYRAAAMLRCDFVLQPIMATRQPAVAEEIAVARTLGLVFPSCANSPAECIVRRWPRDRKKGSTISAAFSTHSTSRRSSTCFTSNEAGNHSVAAGIAPIVLRSVP